MTQKMRCLHTGNECGTDCRKFGAECSCDVCQEWHRLMRDAISTSVRGAILSAAVPAKGESKGEGR